MKKLANYLLYQGQLLQELFFPRCCSICGVAIEEGCLCSSCRPAYSLGRRSLFTGTDYRLSQPQAQDILHKLLLLCKYDGPYKELLQQIKFAPQGRLLYMLMEEAEVALKQLPKEWLAPFDIITNIPTAKERVIKRGYDIPLRLFSIFRDLFPGKYRPHLLVRQRSTLPLYQLQVADRRAELQGCFKLAAGKAVAGKHILLCDDIFTTGSTMAEAATVLYEAGARAVSGLAFTASKDNW